MSDAETRNHWTDHIDADGNWVQRDRGCVYCAVILGWTA